MLTKMNSGGIHIFMRLKLPALLFKRDNVCVQAYVKTSSVFHSYTSTESSKSDPFALKAPGNSCRSHGSLNSPPCGCSPPLRNSLFPYEHMGLERCFLMSQMGHNEHGRPQLPRCPVIIMHPCTSCGIFICMRHDAYLIKRLWSKVPAWQQMSREFLTKCSAFSASPSCDSPNATPPGETDWQPSSCDPTPSNAVALTRSSPLQSADVYSYSQ